MLNYAQLSNQPPTKDGVHGKLICREFNLAFHCPRKYACAKCDRFENATEEEKLLPKMDYDEHLRRKTTAQEGIETDWLKAKQTSDWHV